MTLLTLLKRRPRALVAATLGAVALGGTTASAQAAHTVKFRNTYDEVVTVAYMRYDPAGCGRYGDWQTKGWLRLNPGETKQAFSTSNRYAYFYAHAADGQEWDAENRAVRSKPVYVYTKAFDSCLEIGSTSASDVVRMRKLDLNGKDTVIINLT